MKKTAILALSLAVSFSALAGCGKSSSDSSAAPSGTGASTAPADSKAPAKDVTIKMFQFKVEIAEPLGKMITDYQNANPGVKIQVETVGGGADYGAALKAKFNGGDKPDIFNNGGYSDLQLWQDNLEDLSGEPWVKDLAKGAAEPMTGKDGKLYGMPLNLEGYGFLYNKDLFAKAGITEVPKTLTQLEDAAKKLKAINVTPFENGFGEWWVLGNHFVNLPFAHQADPNKFIDGLNKGTEKIVGNQQFENWVKLFDLELKYGNKNPLQTDYKTQVTEFAMGQAAMTQQGNWTQLQITQTNKDAKIGFMPMPISDDPAENDKLYVGVPNNWVINKNSDPAVKEAAKKFLNWMVSSDTGKKYITQEFKFIPAFTNITADESTLGPLAADIMKYTKDGKVLSWNWFKFPGGEASSKKFGDAMQSYIAGQIKKDQLFADFQSTWDKMKK
jgi:raffinose/stachyose/melibiose transport system substrate-binding protein